MTRYKLTRDNEIERNESNRPMHNADRRLAYTVISPEVAVSTVFLETDHTFGATRSNPILFETMIFGGPEDDWQYRASSVEGALKNHREAVRLALQNVDFPSGDAAIRELRKWFEDQRSNPFSSPLPQHLLPSLFRMLRAYDAMIHDVNVRTHFNTTEIRDLLDDMRNGKKYV